ncbi:hypothetical protein POM88_008573 [Heracleum sosnowskyi]|uniref:Uncharacterized protein n=1 Tax=Heracleum sosnowskyi TaxID=360622 RepID=A0AAD8JA41_9APIA|nr:hypothetical protein POM88_008573 [Heracleum sosnowskyi]
MMKCCSARSCCPSTRAVTAPKKEPVVTMKTPKVEVVKPEPVKKVEDYRVSPVKAEKKEPANVTSVKKEEAVKNYDTMVSLPLLEAVKRRQLDNTFGNAMKILDKLLEGKKRGKEGVNDSLIHLQ